MTTDFIAHRREKDKCEQSVLEHLKGTGCFSKKFAGKIGLEDMGELFGILHDLGKYSNKFQEYLRKSLESKTPKKKQGPDHSTSGAQFIWQQNENNENPVATFFYQMVALCIASHHSGLIDCLKPAGENGFKERMDKPPEKTFINEVVDKCDQEILDKAKDIISSPRTIDQFIDVMKKVTNAVSDVIRDFRIGLLTRFLFSCLIDADRTDTADFEDPERKKLRLNNRYPEWPEFITALEEHLKTFTIRNHVDERRREVSEACKKRGVENRGVYTLSVPTGGGKTLSSLRFALEHARKNKLKRIIFVLPFTTIIDQNADTVREIFNDLSKSYNSELVLEHHSNLTPDEDTLQCKVLSENWDAPIVYTTSVQFLESLFNSGTRGVRRMHQLAESVIVFDEVQALPAKLIHLFNNAVNFLVDICRSSVLLCTATQPSLHKVDETKGAVHLAEKHEIVPDVDLLFKQLQRVEIINRIKPKGWQPGEVAGLAEEELKKSGSVLVIVNTKSAAKAVFECCKDLDAEVFHLSTDMCPVHRMEKLEDIKERLKPIDGGLPLPTVCVSTQLIEAGVDVDFGSAIRYLAGFDSIIQAAGRCNRNALRKTGRVFLVNPAQEKIDSLEDIKAGIEKAYSVLKEFDENPEFFGNNLTHPTVIKKFFKYYFFSRAKEMDYPLPQKELGHEDTLLRLLSTNSKSLQHHKQRPDFYLLQSFKSAGKAFTVIDTKTQGIIVPYGEGEEIITELCASSDIAHEYELMKEAQRFSVNCWPHTIEKLGIGRQGALHDIQESGILCLRPEHYSDDFGVSTEPIAAQSPLLLV